jgi:hypothetical protein
LRRLRGGLLQRYERGRDYVEYVLLELLELHENCVESSRWCYAPAGFAPDS